jgi:hypothetical protein
MKSSFWTILLAVGFTAIITFFATRNYYGKSTVQSIKGTRSEQSDTFELRGHEYGIEQAQKDIDSFQALLDTVIGHAGQAGLPKGAINGIVGYTIDATDLVHALGTFIQEDKTIGVTYPFVRVYLGFNNDEGKFKLFVVPVSTSDPADKCGKDMFFIEPQSMITPPRYYIGTGEANLKCFVLDLISPCPSTCDVSSPLVAGIPTKVKCDPTQAPNKSSAKK